MEMLGTWLRRQKPPKRRSGLTDRCGRRGARASSVDAVLAVRVYGGIADRSNRATCLLSADGDSIDIDAPDARTTAAGLLVPGMLSFRCDIQSHLECAVIHEF